MKRLPTDLQILDAVYDRYYDAFSQYQEGDPSRVTKVYVPVDLAEIARELRVDGDIVFGRLYYHLEKKYGYRGDDGVRVHLFTLELRHEGKADRHCVNFPYWLPSLPTFERIREGIGSRTTLLLFLW